MTDERSLARIEHTYYYTRPVHSHYTASHILVLVSYDGDVEELQLLLQHNADVTAKDGYNWILHTASFTRHIEATKLLEDGPDVDVLAIIADITTLSDCY